MKFLLTSKVVFFIDNNEFLREQFDLLKRKQIDTTIEWQDVAEFRADYLGTSEHRDTCRKGSKLFYEYLNAGWIREPSASALSKARDIVGEEYLAKRQVQNEKLLINRFKRDMVKSLSVAEDLATYQEERGFIVNVPEYSFVPIIDTSKNIMICNISDWHIGYEIIDCHGNDFNWKIANARVDEYIAECKKYIQIYGIKKVFVVNTGDTIEGTYMRETQSESCEFLQSEQVNRAIELIFRLLVALSEKCTVVYAGLAGNHDRMSGDKKKSLDGDNANVIINEQIKVWIKLSNTKRISVIDTKYNDKEIILTINGLRCKFIHGHEVPRIDNHTLANMISCDNEFYDLLFMGHWHNYTCKYENNGRYVVTTGCLSGYNDYSRSFYCSTKASQTICILSGNKVELIKNIELN